MNAMDQMPNGFSLAWDRLGSAPETEFMVTPDLTIRRKDLAGIVTRLAFRLESLGARHGDHIFIRTKDEECAVATVLTCLLEGLVPVMVSAETPDERAASIASFAEARMLVLDAPIDGLRDIPTLWVTDAKPPQKRLSLRKPSAEDAVAARLDLGPDARAPRLPRDPKALAYILFTSGTTSDPAGVMISHKALLSNLATIAEVHQIDETSRLFNDMILAHADGLIQGPVMALLTGATVVRAGGFSVDRIEDWLNRVRSQRCTHFTTVPTVWALIDRYCAHEDYFDAPEFCYLGSVAAALPYDLWDRIESRFGKPLISQYGLTETVASALYAGRAPGAGARHTAGLPVDCEARIDKVNGAAAGEGELLLRGTNIFDGYWKNPERTAATLAKDNWLRTGDLAALRDDGSYEIKGRLKTVIMSAGFLIRPEEIDDAMTQHPKVHESVTVALPHAEFGEIAVTAVVCAPDGPDDEALRNHAQTRLEALKVPKHIVWVDTVPRGDAGKPRLDAVRAMLSDRITEPAQTSGAGELDEKLLELAASVFYMPTGELTLSATPDTVEGWDSFTHISLILALEEGFGVRIPPHRAAALRSLSDAAIAIREAT